MADPCIPVQALVNHATHHPVHHGVHALHTSHHPVGVHVHAPQIITEHHWAASPFAPSPSPSPACDSAPTADGMERVLPAGPGNSFTGVSGLEGVGDTATKAGYGTAAFVGASGVALGTGGMAYLASTGRLGGGTSSSSENTSMANNAFVNGSPGNFGNGIPNDIALLTPDIFSPGNVHGFGLPPGMTHVPPGIANQGEGQPVAVPEPGTAVMLGTVILMTILLSRFAGFRRS